MRVGEESRQKLVIIFSLLFLISQSSSRTRNPFFFSLHSITTASSQMHNQKTKKSGKFSRKSGRRFFYVQSTLDYVGLFFLDFPLHFSFFTLIQTGKRIRRKSLSVFSRTYRRKVHKRSSFTQEKRGKGEVAVEKWKKTLFPFFLFFPHCQLLHNFRYKLHTENLTVPCRWHLVYRLFSFSPLLAATAHVGNYMRIFIFFSHSSLFQWSQRCQNL